MANNPQNLLSNWFQTAADLTEAALRATAQVQLQNLDRWMETMTGAARAGTSPEENPFTSMIPVLGEQAGEKKGPQEPSPSQEKENRGQHRQQSRSEPRRKAAKSRSSSQSKAKGGRASRSKGRPKAGGRR